MNDSARMQLTKPSAREIAVVRTFDAPRALVFRAYTTPELVERWLYGPEEWPMVHCTIVLEPGGALRYVWRNKAKGDMGVSGVFREIVPPERLVHTELFDEDWTGGETLATTGFAEQAGRTTVTTTVLYSSQAARDAALKTGMLEGWNQCYDRFAALLASMPGRER